MNEMSSTRKALLLLIGLLASAALHAQDSDDIRRILEQGTQQKAIERERELLKDELGARSERPIITIDGQTHTVGKNANDLGRALYLSMQHRQWQAAANFLAEYLTLPDRDPKLVHYAQGLLARILGRHTEAEREYRALLKLQPDFVLARMELARVLFEDQQDGKAQQLFAAILASTDAADPKTEGVRKTISSYQQALEQRLGWNGSLAFGPTWTDNVNRTSASHDCLWLHEDSGICIIDRKLPDAIRASGLDYDASLSKRWVLYGHHGLSFRTMAFGQSYRDHSQYNELNANAQAGYNYRSARHNAVLAPSFDYYALGNSTLYSAWGLHGEWSYALSSKSLLKLEGDWKDMRYRQDLYANNYNGIQRSLSATWFRSFGPHWMAFAGVDALSSDAPINTNAYGSLGVRIGTLLQWPNGFSNTIFASYREREYDAYSALLGARREDDEQSYVLIVKANRWNVAGFTPLLTLRHNRISSNVDWLYSYDRNTASLKLERTF